ncbi:MAG TPA: fibronectin type III domain-containing protein, partial [Nitrososphaera sp.]|nr:fibronectin type III domain-containing protein [Nitrososphaera sp.]
MTIGIVVSGLVVTQVPGNLEKTGLTMKSQYFLAPLLGTISRMALIFGVVFGSFSSVFGAVPTSFVQEKDRQVTSGTTNSVAFASSTTAGNLIAVYVIWDNLGSVSVTDSAGNAYFSAVGPTPWNSNRYNTQVFYAKNIRGGTDTVTARFSMAVRSFGIVYAHEYAQLDQVSPVDAVAGAVGSGSTMNTGLVPTTNPNDLLFGAGVSSYAVTSAGNGYTARSTAEGNITEDRVVSAPGSYSATAIQNGTFWAMQIVAFRFAGFTQPQDTSVPTIPTGISAVPVSSSQINLSWAASTDTNDTAPQLKYRVYRNGSLIGTTAAGTTAWQDTGLASGTTYTYTASAQDPAGNSSAPSASVEATTTTAMPSISSFKA